MLTLAAVMSCGKFYSGCPEKLSEGKFPIVKFSRASSSLSRNQFSVKMDIFDSG